jgi:hypothetical protein
MKDWANPKSDWILIKSKDESGWNEEFKQMQKPRKFDSDYRYVPDYRCEVLGEKALRIQTNSGLKGSSADCEYWYFLKPDGTDAILFGASSKIENAKLVAEENNFKTGKYEL